VQLAYWRCSICDGVYEYKLVKLLVDTDDDDPDAPRDLDAQPQAEYIVCSFCQKKGKGRFRAKSEL
jgi:hypothetical protein